MEKMMKIWKFILTNVDTLVAILVGILATTFGIIQQNQYLLLAGIAIVLALLAIGLIRDRLNREILSEQISELRKSLPDRPSAMAFFQAPQDIRPSLQRALQIDLCGVTLTSTLNKEYGTLRERLQAGAKIRIMIIDPDSLAIEMSAQRTGNPKDLDYHRTRLDSALREIAYIYKSMRDTKPKKGAPTGSLGVRLLPYAPSFGILSMDARQKDGIAFIELYPHKFGYMTPVVFDLTPERDQSWHDYFVKQFDVMWDAAKPWDPKAYLDKIPFAKDE